MPTDRRRFLASTGIAVATGFGAQSTTAQESTDSVSFTDVPERHWAHPQITALAENGFISGYGERFFPEEPITRGQLAALLTKAYSLDEPRGISRFPSEFSALFGGLFESSATESQFDDIEDHWATEQIELAVEAGFMGPYDTDGDGTAVSTKFEPQKAVSRLELITILQTDFQFSERYAVGTEFPLTEAYLSGFEGQGIETVEGTDRDAIARMMDAGKLRNDEQLFHVPGETNLNPLIPATRAHAVNLLYNMRPQFLSGGTNGFPAEDVDYLQRGDLVRDDRLMLDLRQHPWSESATVGDSNATEATVIDIQQRGSEYWLFINTENNVNGWIEYNPQELDVQYTAFSSDQSIVAAEDIEVITAFEEGPGVDLTDVPAGTEGVVTGPKREEAGLYNATELRYEVLFNDVDGQDVRGFVDPTDIQRPRRNTGRFSRGATVVPYNSATLYEKRDTDSEHVTTLENRRLYVEAGPVRGADGQINWYKLTLPRGPAGWAKGPEFKTLRGE